MSRSFKEKGWRVPAERRRRGQMFLIPHAGLRDSSPELPAWLRGHSSSRKRRPVTFPRSLGRSQPGAGDCFLSVLRNLKPKQTHFQHCWARLPPAPAGRLGLFSWNEIWISLESLEETINFCIHLICMQMVSSHYSCSFNSHYSTLSLSLPPTTLAGPEKRPARLRICVSSSD